MNEENKIMRRQVVVGLGTALAAAVVSPALAASAEETPLTKPPAMEDARRKYPNKHYTNPSTINYYL